MIRDFSNEAAATWGKIFINEIEQILRETPEREISHNIAVKYIKAKFPDTYRGNRYYLVEDADLKKVRFQLEALGLIRAELVDESLVWKITEKGRRYMSEIKATRA